MIAAGVVEALLHIADGKFQMERQQVRGAQDVTLPKPHDLADIKKDSFGAVTKRLARSAGVMISPCSLIWVEAGRVTRVRRGIRRQRR